MTDLILSEKNKLQGTSNFVIWSTTITNYLRSKKLLKYVERDYVMFKQFSPDGQKLTEEMKLHNEEVDAQNATAVTAIFTNVSDKIKIYIKDLISAKEIMNKIKSLYETNEANYYGRWINKLYTIHAKDINDTMNVINEIMELFKKQNLSNFSKNPSRIL